MRGDPSSRMQRTTIWLDGANSGPLEMHPDLIEIDVRDGGGLLAQWEKKRAEVADKNGYKATIERIYLPANRNPYDQIRGFIKLICGELGIDANRNSLAEMYAYAEWLGKKRREVDFLMYVENGVIVRTSIPPEHLELMYEIEDSLQAKADGYNLDGLPCSVCKMVKDGDVGTFQSLKPDIWVCAACNIQAAS